MNQQWIVLVAVFFVLVPVFLVIGSLCSLLWPRAMWFLSEGWKFKNAEPSGCARHHHDREHHRPSHHRLPLRFSEEPHILPAGVSATIVHPSVMATLIRASPDGCSLISHQAP
jgi:hypothetical protein